MITNRLFIVPLIYPNFLTIDRGIYTREAGISSSSSNVLISLTFGKESSVDTISQSK